MKSSVITKIGFSQTDDKCNLSFGKMIDFLQDCTNYQSESLGVGIEYQKKRRRAWLLSSWELEIRGQLKYGEEIVVSTWPYDFRGACGKRNITIARTSAPEDYIVLADSKWAMFDVEKQTLARVSEADSSAYELEDRLEMQYTAGKISCPAEYIKRDRFIVRKYQLDLNNHMNNAWYIKIAEEFLEDKSRVCRIRVEYKKSAKYMDEIVVCIAEEEKRMVAELRSSENDVYAVVEFGF